MGSLVARYLVVVVVGVGVDVRQALRTGPRPVQMQYTIRFDSMR
jgi:hypothetical protein